MKLIYKYTLWYLLISLGVFVVGSIITYQVMKREISREQERFLRERLTFVERMVDRRQPDSVLVRDKIRVEPLPQATAETEISYSDTVVMHSTLERMEPHTKLEVVREVAGKFYHISLYDVIVEQDDIIESVRESMIKVYLLLTGTVLLLGVFAGLYLFKPFNKTLNLIRNFDLDRGQPIRQIKTGTQEFDRLNQFLEEMTTKVQTDYNALKEFSENASHEMQTPLANAIGKLELLLNNPKLEAKESQKVMGALDSLRQISKMGQSLGLLTKIENREFANKAPLDFSTSVTRALDNFQELIDLKSITLERSITPHVEVIMDPNLADIMINNLLSNAIRHNERNGIIRTKVDESGFIICNTGKPPSAAPDSLFDRFKKDSNGRDGMGLGLSIVKKICDVSGFKIDYWYELNEHRLEIEFVR
ncbi:MAG: HAMP domain-containing histidine kinase [Cyclobacteriaceae bacterium]|nr:HAMP domain-containing histidine kinase [Cyclobacteriaceae bacterium]